MTDQTAEQVTPAITEADVEAYLERHPDFFERHEQLLQKLSLPHDSGRAISLVERQVHLFREQRDALREELSGLIGIARQNDQLFARSKRLLMQLLDAGSLEEIANVLDERIRGDFNLQSATLTVLTNEEASSQCGALRYLDADSARAIFGEALDEEKPLFGRLRQEYREALFSQPDQVGSAAVIPVRRNYCLGLIAVSSEQEDYFDSSMGSLFMTYISDTLGRLLPPLIEPLGSDTQQPEA
ncbi:hypothetical protein DES49_0432 [Halospina denitrificans]|uniref:DUF484 family protein n=1 Tax=Halospina denitrificans TaxID=332522 RepID=A0A4R7K0G9_9GAMM|nr:DUF484 family protein [Halospina denitrificans]TDT44330.1 hypothetical protein DES49_0432 [Halospina denitrificans]